MKLDQVQAIYSTATVEELDFINYVECGEPVSHEDANKYNQLIKDLRKRSRGNNQ